MRTAALAPALDEDYHVHSTYSDDGTSSITDNLAVAASRGLRTICMADHVRAGTTWLPDFTSAVAGLTRPDGLRVLAGVEAKILDMTGRLDLPGDLAGVDVVLIADHQFPADVGPVDPAVMARDLAAGEVTVADAVDCLVEATANAAGTVPNGLLAHLFSVLPKIGLSEDDVPVSRLAWLAAQLTAAGASAEVNEKWACPGPRTVMALAQAGVPLVAGSDSHDSRAIGAYRSVRRTAAAAFGSPAG